MSLTHSKCYLLRASRWWVAILVAVFTFGFSNAELTYTGLRVAVPVIITWFVVWLIRLGVWLWRRSKGKTAALTSPWFSWAFEPLCLTILIGLVSINGLMWGRFLISSPFLQSFALEKISAGAQKYSSYDNEYKLCGLYRLYNLETGVAEDGSEQFLVITTNDTFTDAAGFAFVLSEARPKGIATGQPCYFDHLYGGWWLWRLDQ